MANELKHKDIGDELTKVEFEDVTLHQLDSQAAGDLIKAISATQLSRLPIDSNGKVLTVVSGVPAWADSPSLSRTTLWSTDRYTTSSTSWVQKASDTVPAAAKHLVVALGIASDAGAYAYGRILYNGVEKLSITTSGSPSVVEFGEWSGAGLGSAAAASMELKAGGGNAKGGSGCVYLS